MGNFLKDFENYAIVPSIAIRDKRLSLSTLGMWAFLCNLPNDWNYSVRGLAAAKGCGVKAVNSALKALEQYGYLQRIQHRNGNKFDRIDYLLVAEPSDQGDAVMSCARKGDTEKSEYAQKEYLQKESHVEDDNILSTNIIHSKKIHNIHVDSFDPDIIEMMRRRNLIDE